LSGGGGCGEFFTSVKFLCVSFFSFGVDDDVAVWEMEGGQ